MCISKFNILLNEINLPFHKVLKNSQEEQSDNIGKRQKEHMLKVSENLKKEIQVRKYSLHTKIRNLNYPYIIVLFVGVPKWAKRTGQEH